MKKLSPKQRRDYNRNLALQKFSALHYKVWLLLRNEVLTQKQIADILGTKKQTLSEIIKDLKETGYVVIHHTEGLNKYLTLGDEPKPAAPKPDPNQLTFDKIPDPKKE